MTNDSISISGRISRAIAVSILSFFLMLYAFHLIQLVKFPDFWDGVALLVEKYMAGDLGHHFFWIWVKAVIYSATHWRGALEISSSLEIAIFVAWRVDKFFMRYHSRFLRDSTKK